MGYLGGFGLLSILCAVVIALIMESTAMTDTMSLSNPSAPARSADGPWCDVHREGPRQLTVSWDPVSLAVARMQSIDVTVTGPGTPTTRRHATLDAPATVVVQLRPNNAPVVRCTVSPFGTGTALTQVISIGKSNG